MSANAESPASNIILPAFNAENYVGEAVSSIRIHTFTEFDRTGRFPPTLDRLSR